MPSVALEVSPDGALRLVDHAVEWHDTNASFLSRIRRLSPAVVCIDGPCATNGLRVLPDWSGWDLKATGGVREAERLLAKEGVGLYWTTCGTVTRFDGASRWIARSLLLFEEVRAGAGVPIETHPHGAFRFLRQILGIPPELERKSTREGRTERVQILQAFIQDLDADVLGNHDAVDAAVAALIAALHWLGRTVAFGSATDGGEIRMPAREMPDAFVRER
jgi:predicted nuclease with RNAse H fold